MVASAALASAIFDECGYLQRFLARGREANRRTLCRGAEKALSWANLIGDCAVGHWLSVCARGLNVTLAHMTYSKAHHYTVGAGGQGWVEPGNGSIAVHDLKRHSGASGPDRSEGGEWRHTHETVVRARGPGFPPLLWTYRPHRVRATGRLLGAALNPDVHAWYASQRRLSSHNIA
jgi:hypothetical protein